MIGTNAAPLRRSKVRSLPSARTAQESTKNTTISAALAQDTTFVTPATLRIRAGRLVGRFACLSPHRLLLSRTRRITSHQYLTPGDGVGYRANRVFLDDTRWGKRPESAVDRNRPIGADAFYLFCLVLFLSAAALSVLSLRAALREADEERAWVSAGYFAIASLLAIVF
jgi:hypothetical protein